jgi:ADP-ribose pyrophosphatase
MITGQTTYANFNIRIDHPRKMPKILREHEILRGSRFSVSALELLGDDGGLYQREVVRHPGAVVILPILDRDCVVLIQNQRPSVRQTLLELPAGTREPDEAPEVTAHRELIEETGYRAGQIELLHSFYSAPGICDELMHLYVARDLSCGEAAREALEDITNRIATRDDIVRWIAEGQIRDAKTLVGLYAFLYAPQLRP